MEVLIETRSALLGDFASLFDYLKLDLTTAFGASDIEKLDVQVLQQRLDEWAASDERLFQWVTASTSS